MITSGIIRIRTPEGVVFSQPLAGPVARALAWMIDGLIVFGVTMTLILATAMLAVLSFNLALVFFFVGQFLLGVGYRIWLEWIWRGQTIGKRVFGLRVVDAEGLRLRFPQIVIRNVLRFADALPLAYAVGGVACALSPRCQRLGDLAAGTLVVRTTTFVPPDPGPLEAGKFNSLREYPHLAARLRQHTTPEETAVLARALARRTQLEPAARVALYAELAQHFRDKVRFPSEATEGLSDEQYLRDVADVLLRPQVRSRRETQPETEPLAARTPSVS